MQRGGGGVWREPGEGLESYKMSANDGFVLNGQAALLGLQFPQQSSAMARLKRATASAP